MMNPYESPRLGESNQSELTTAPARRVWVIFAALSLLPFIWLSVSIEHGQPMWWHPYPLMPFLVAFRIKSKLISFAVLSSVILPLFALFCWPLSLGQNRIPKRSILLLVVFVFDCVYVLAMYASGVEHLGRGHMLAVGGITTGIFFGLLALGLHCISRPSFGTALGFQWLAWFWLVLYAFPALSPLFVLV